MLSAFGKMNEKGGSFHFVVSQRLAATFVAPRTLHQRLRRVRRAYHPAAFTRSWSGVDPSTTMFGRLCTASHKGGCTALASRDRVREKGDEQHASENRFS